MTEPALNPYQALGIERDADERAIKKAYFALVRKFPPETHPDDFKRIRAAYELLSDPVARRRYDNQDRDYAEYGEDIGAALRDAEESGKAGEDAEVQRKLRLILEQRPDLAIARENLALSLLRTGEFKEALDELRKLTKASPEEPRYLLHKAYALHRLEKHDKAEAALRKARRLRPDDLRIRLELVDMLLGYGKPDGALEQVDEELEAQAPGSELSIILRLRRVEALAAKDDPETQVEVDRIFASLEGKDPEIRRFVGSQLGGVAARRFARNDPAGANALLARCLELQPESAVLRPYPASATLDLRALPEEGQRWLASLPVGPTTPTMSEPTWPALSAALLGASGLALLTAFVLFSEPAPWSGESLAGSALAVLASVAALAFAGRAVIRVLRSPIRALTTVHPLFLVRAVGSRVKVYSLFTLCDLQAVHHHQNGVYSHCAVSMKFDKERVSLRLKGPEYAEGWLQFLLHTRRRAIELMGEGFLEAEHGIELLPPTLLTAPEARAPRWFGSPRFLGATAAAAAILWAALIPLRARAADEVAFGRAIRVGSVAAYGAYLAASPDGRHAGEARQQIARRFERGRAALAAATDEGAPPAKPLLDALAALEAQGEARVPLRVTVNEGGAAPVAWPKQEAIAHRLNRVLQAAGVGDVMQLVAGGGAAPDPAPVTLEVQVEAAPEGGALVAAGVEDIPAPPVHWDAQLVAPGGGEPLLRLSAVVPPPRELRVPTSDVGEVRRRAEERLAQIALDGLVDALARELGLTNAAQAKPVAKPEELRGGLGVEGRR